MRNSFVGGILERANRLFLNVTGSEDCLRKLGISSIVNIILVLVVFIIEVWVDGFGKIVNCFSMPLLICLFIHIIFWSYYYLHNNKVTKTLAGSLVVAFSITFLYWNAALISRVTYKNNYASMIVGSLIIDTIFFILSYKYIKIIRGSEDGFKFKNLFIKIKSDPFTYLIIVVFSVLLLFDLDGIPQWDGGWFYYYQTQHIYTFDFTFKSFVLGMQWFGHPVHFYGLYMSIGQFLFPGNYEVANIQKIILSCFGIYAFSRIVRYFSDEKASKIELGLVTAMYAFSPMVLGLTPYFDIDTPLIPIMCIFIASYINKNKVLTTYSLLTMVFCKETGVMFYGVFLLVVLFYDFKDLGNIKFKDKITTFIEKRFYLLIPGFTTVLYMIMGKFKLWYGGASILEAFADGSEGKQHYFGFEPKYIFEQLVKLFGINFIWILTLGVIIFGIIAIARKHRFIRKNTADSGTPSDDKKRLYTAFIWMFISNIVFYCLFVTSNNYRYLAINIMFMGVFFYKKLCEVVRSKGIRAGVLSVIVVLFFIQSYRTIDPTMGLFFKEIKFGDHTIVNANNSSDRKNDSLVYNKQYSYISKLYDKMRTEMDLGDDGYTVFLSDLNWSTCYSSFKDVYFYYNDKQTGKRTIVGNQLAEGVEPKNVIGKDLPAEKVYDGMPSEIIDNEPVKNIDLWSWDKPFKERNDLPSEIIVVQMSWEDDEMLEPVKSRYGLSNKRKIEIDGYWLHIYDGKLIN